MTVDLLVFYLYITRKMKERRPYSGVLEQSVVAWISVNSRLFMEPEYLLLCSQEFITLSYFRLGELAHTLISFSLIYVLLLPLYPRLCVLSGLFSSGFPT
jgi:hypothetical protein